MLERIPQKWFGGFRVKKELIWSMKRGRTSALTPKAPGRVYTEGKMSMIPVV
jgi:hypothetical protein